MSEASASLLANLPHEHAIHFAKEMAFMKEEMAKFLAPDDKASSSEGLKVCTVNDINAFFERLKSERQKRLERN